MAVFGCGYALEAQTACTHVQAELGVQRKVQPADVMWSSKATHNQVLQSHLILAALKAKRFTT